MLVETDWVNIEKNPVVYPELVDGKLLKACEFCGDEFEVMPRGQARCRYCPPCRKSIKNAKGRVRAQKKGYFLRSCDRCGEKRSKDLFPDSTSQRGKMGTCLFCQPFLTDWGGKYTPSCGAIKDGTFIPSCPLFDDCKRRIMAGLWMPCTVPFKSDLLFVEGLDDNDYLLAMALLEKGLGPGGKVVNQGWEYWINRYWSEIPQVEEVCQI